MKPRKPDIIELLKAKQAAATAPTIQANDIRNIMFAARAGLSQMRGVDLVNVATSLANIEAAFAAMAPAPPAADHAPASAEKPAEAKKD